MNEKQLIEDEIDLRELFLTICKRKFLIIVITFLITLGAGVFAFTKTPIYEVKAVLKVGSISNSNSNDIENVQNLIERLKITYMNNQSNESEAYFKSIKLIRGTKNLVEFSVQAPSNKLAKEKLKVLVQKVKDKHESLIQSYKSLIKNKINNLKLQKQELEQKENQFEGSLAIKFNLTSNIDELQLQISSYNIKETEVVGKYIISDYPIKPKKNLIVMVAFITGFILSIFLVFLLEFINGLKREKNEK